MYRFCGILLVFDMSALCMLAGTIAHVYLFVFAQFEGQHGGSVPQLHRIVVVSA
jgi:hypothetical protein